MGHQRGKRFRWTDTGTCMVLIEHWLAQIMLRLHVLSKIGLFREKQSDLTTVDLTNCLQQIEIPGLLPMCTPCSELPSNVSSMGTLYSISQSGYVNVFVAP